MSTPTQSIEQRVPSSLGSYVQSTPHQQSWYLFERVGEAVQATLFTRCSGEEKWQEKHPILEDQIFIVSGADETPLSGIDAPTLTNIMSEISASQRTLHLRGGHYEGWPMDTSLLVQSLNFAPQRNRDEYLEQANLVRRRLSYDLASVINT